MDRLLKVDIESDLVSKNLFLYLLDLTINTTFKKYEK